jgi:TPR repeat protein
MNIYGFIKLYEITDNMINTYNCDQINSLNQIVCGNIAENYDDPILANYCGLYYCKEKKYDQAERYYLMAIDKGHINSMNNLGYMYEEIKKYDPAERYYLMAIEKGHIGAMHSLGYMYKKIKKYDQAERYYLMAIENGCIDSMNNLGYMYRELKKYDQSERYLLMGTDKGDIDAMHNLGSLYKKLKKYDQAERYYLMATDKGDINAIHNLGLLYNKLKKYDQAERYYLMTLTIGSDDLEPTIECLERLIGNQLRLFVVLDRLKSSNDIVVQKLKELMNNQTVRYFANKRSKLSKDGECPVCYDELKLIPRECAHYYCEDCYVRIDRCCFGCDN